jgi:hypothetical protein
LNVFEAHTQLCHFIESIVTSIQGDQLTPTTTALQTYLIQRGQNRAAIHRDLLPLLVYVAISKQTHDRVIPLTAAWALRLAASHYADDVQDNGNVAAVNPLVSCLALSNSALMRLGVDEDTSSDIFDAFVRAEVLAAEAQNKELHANNIWTVKYYQRNILAKSAIIIATGAWIGGRFATDDRVVLEKIKGFGLAVGIATQILDDCMDLQDDLGHSIYTLPVIIGANKNHEYQTRLKQLVEQDSLEDCEIDEIIEILHTVGAISSAKRVAQGYLAQAKTVINEFPGLEPFFLDYVS